MGEIKKPSAVNLIIGMIYNKEKIIVEEVMDKLVACWGEIDKQSKEFNFSKLSETNYYKEEMGDNLYRKFLSFKELILPDEIVKIKLTTNTLEEEFAEKLDNQNRKRRINLDPGYISYNSLILASTKAAPHRIYLSSGIWAEITLIFFNKKFMPLMWTYRDYKSEEYIKFFEKIRIIYKRKLKNK